MPNIPLVTSLLFSYPSCPKLLSLHLPFLPSWLECHFLDLYVLVSSLFGWSTPCSNFLWKEPKQCFHLVLAWLSLFFCSYTWVIICWEKILGWISFSSRILNALLCYFQAIPSAVEKSNGFGFFLFLKWPLPTSPLLFPHHAVPSSRIFPLSIDFWNFTTSNLSVTRLLGCTRWSHTLGYPSSPCL